MSQIIKSPPIAPAQPESAAWVSLSALNDVVRAQCARHGINSTVSKAFLLAKLCIAAQGTAYVVDDQNHRIPLAFNLLAQVPWATGTALMQELAGLLTQIEIATAAPTNMRFMHFLANREMRAEALSQTKMSIKVAIAKAARRKALEAQLDTLDAQKPKEDDYEDFPSKLLSWEKQVAELEIAYEQAKAEGDTVLAKALFKELREKRANPPQSYETVFERWRVKHAPIAAQYALLDGADAEPGRLNAELAELLAAKAREREPAVAKLLHRNTPIPALLTALESGWPVGTVVYDVDMLPRMLVKHAAAVAGACDAGIASLRAPGRVQPGFVGTATPGSVVREVKTLGPSAAVLALLHIVADSPEAASGQVEPSADPACLAWFDQHIVEMGVAKILAMMQDDFTPAEITLSGEAAEMLLSERRALHAHRTGDALHPMYDAYLARMPRSLCQVAGVLHQGRNEHGPLTAETMRIAIETCLALSDEFKRVAVPAPEIPESVRLAWTLRHALYGYVDQQMEAGAKQPFHIALSTLCNKTASVGMSRAQIRRAAFAMRDLGWVSIEPDGLDQVIKMDPHCFGKMHRQ
ncbi:DUF3987 domain-containing protein [Paraburkholderia strydomiana]|jgi:hypothetical protein|uniref:DUF3987 domain-containing protein n=1 Tax=Paraburkholderia strydomiana TaxID=1245417 RepID=UPI0038B9112E